MDRNGPAVEIRSREPSEGILKLRHDCSVLAAEHVVIPHPKPHEFKFRGDSHYLALLNARRKDGETLVDGLPRSTVRDGRGKLIFVPAGCRLEGWAQPTSSPVVFTAAYIDPSLCAWLDGSPTALTPALHFEHPLLAEMMLRLLRVLEQPGSHSRMYVEAFALVLMSELMDAQPGGVSYRGESRLSKRNLDHLRGGLAGWQRRAVCEYIEEHLPEEISLADLAAIARLSPSHFCRAFKEAIGQPPHQYQISRRIERAKALLADPGLSVSHVATAVGYHSESRFSAIFKRVTGRPPGRFRRN